MEKIKYPKTPHVPWSVGTSDDKTLADDEHLKGKRVVVTLKMDGENTSIYSDGTMHARSCESAMHPSQSWVKKLAGEIGYQLGEDVRVCGENVYAKHTVPYDDLLSYFLCFSIWEREKCSGWTEVMDMCAILGLETVPVIYIGEYDKDTIIRAFEPFKEKHEGYVIRNYAPFNYDEFEDNVAKFVNPGFRQTLKENNIHWASAPVIPNKLRKDVK